MRINTISPSEYEMHACVSMCVCLWGSLAKSFINIYVHFSNVHYGIVGVGLFQFSLTHPQQYSFFLSLSLSLYRFLNFSFAQFDFPSGPNSGPIRFVHRFHCMNRICVKMNRDKWWASAFGGARVGKNLSAQNNQRKANKSIYICTRKTLLPYMNT